RGHPGRRPAAGGGGGGSPTRSLLPERTPLSVRTPTLREVAMTPEKASQNPGWWFRWHRLEGADPNGEAIHLRDGTSSFSSPGNGGPSRRIRLHRVTAPQNDRTVSPWAFAAIG